jgi:hypothetical protein
VSDDIRERALTEITQFEAAAFRFGHQVRSFLAAFPEVVSAPIAVLPRFGSGTDADGDIVMGGRSYVHLVVKTEGEVHAWASLLKSPLEREVTDEQKYVSVSTHTEGDLDGLRVYVGALDTHKREQWEQLQEDGASPDSDAG